MIKLIPLNEYPTILFKSYKDDDDDIKMELNENTIFNPFLDN